MTTFIRILAVVLYLCGIGVCIYFIGGTELTARESALLSVILTILSILATWTVSHLYSESQHTRAIKEVKEMHQANLKTYARKAAEKVNNLSNQLGLLSAYLEKELATTDYDNVQEELNAKEERIESAVHIINALKSVNDTALSDWEGVIGDELDKQREEKAEREEELEELLANYETMLSSLQTDVKQRGEHTHVLETEINRLRSQLQYLSARITGMPFSLSGVPSKRKNIVSMKCSECGQPISFRIKQKQGTIKALQCKSCRTQFVARSEQDGKVSLESRKPIKVAFNCASCGSRCEIEIDPMPGYTVTYQCPQCKTEMRVVRTKDGVTTKLKPPPPQAKRIELDETVIERVRVKLPPQPWPKGIHGTIATELNLTKGVVLSAINELIRRGVFNPQVDGKVYVPGPEHRTNQSE
jgi:DNA-directed RNA polymerase subunit RPC12/RpoP